MIKSSSSWRILNAIIFAMRIEDRQIALNNKNVFLSCVVPVYNEEAVIVSFVANLQAVLREITNQYEIILVDDGSRDLTVQKILSLSKDSHVKLLGLSRNFGKEVALTAGIEHATGEAVILLDADFQHPMETINIFLKHWAEGYDMVYGIRVDRESESYLKRNFAHGFYWLMQKIAKVDMPRDAGDFRLMDRKIISALKEFPERTRFMKGLYAWVGFKKNRRSL